MGKTRDLFKKIRDTKRTFHAKMGSIKDRNHMDLTEAEDIKKRWQSGSVRRIYKQPEKDRREREGEKERYPHLNAEFQRIARRDKKAFLSDQCKDKGKQQNGKD